MTTPRFQDVDFVDNAPPAIVIPGAGVGDGGDSGFSEETERLIAIARGEDVAPRPRDTPGTTEDRQTLDLILRDNIKAMLPDIPSAWVSQFADAWVAKQPTWTVDQFLNNQQFNDGLSFLPMWAGGVQPPPYFQSDGQAYRADLARGIFSVGSAESAQAAFESFIIPEWNIQEGFGRVRAVGRGGGRGGGGGGGGRAARTFDQRQLEEAATQMWQTKILQRNDKATTAAVKEYMKKANAFWVTSGGSLDFETFINDKIRETERYRILYADKPAEMTDEQFLGPFSQAVAQGAGGFLRPAQQTAELETALQSGGSAAGQARRVQQSEDVFRQQPTQFGAAFANQIRSLGRAAQR